MASLRFRDFHLHHETPEAGRYAAPILVLPGLFQSFECWRPLTSMLAHRGWDVYCLARTMPDLDGDPRLLDRTWEEASQRVLKVAPRLGDALVVFGADVGAALALTLADRLPLLAMALFSPCDPAHAGLAWQKSRPFLERSGLRGNSAASLAAPVSWSGVNTAARHLITEPADLLTGLATLAVDLPAAKVPTVVFAADGDPLVDAEHALRFVRGPSMRAARTRLAGRLWPAAGSAAAVADEVHRFLILTLADRVVEFPDEVLEG